MILTCPECASRYFVDDSKVGSAGRVVRCASCGNRWIARNEESTDLFDEPSAATMAGDAAMAPMDAAASASAASETESEPPVSALPGEELPKVFRARADAERRLREATTTGVVWAGMAAAMASMIVGALIFRIDMVRLWPTTAGAYASVGLPVNTVGLVIENLKAEPSLEDGHAAVTITGVMRNITDHAVIAPPLRVELRNAKDKRVAGRIAAAADPKIPPSEIRHFAITILDPPRTARDLVIDFAVEPGAAKAVKAALKTPAKHAADPELSLRGAQNAAAGEAAGHEPSGHETGTEATPSSDSHEPAHHE
ncbi:MJ0042-type zinc finger domain-containing protein [Caulobacter sp. DWR1-3-2b1]|uniref:MJ0042-type zinc finger domain-containing protein n=1 Tax=Caulobacter sp. DWR1-3-2b1 TaxID=2804670 RepID=UPI003CF55F6C